MNPLHQEVTAREIVGFLGDRVSATSGNLSQRVVGPVPLTPGQAGCLSFASASEGSTNAIGETRSTVVIAAPSDFALVSSRSNAALIATAEPRREFARIVEQFFIEPFTPGIDRSAVVHATAHVDSTCYVGANSVIAEKVEIGPRCWIGPNVTILSGTRIGAGCSIGPGTVIGSSGFGYSREDDGTPVQFPHVGGVVIGNHVDIGANTAIDRGAIGDTTIADDVKIDNLVHIAHNCQIAQGAFVIATAMVAGSVYVGARAWIAPNASVRQKLVIGEDAVVGLGAVVTKDVAAGNTVAGNPARVWGS